MKAVRRLLEGDLGLETGDLDSEKEDIKGLVDKVRSAARRLTKLVSIFFLDYFLSHITGLIVAITFFDAAGATNGG